MKDRKQKKDQWKVFKYIYFYLEYNFFNPGSLGKEVQHWEARVRSDCRHGHPVASIWAWTNIVRKTRQVVYECVHPSLVQTGYMDSCAETEKLNVNLQIMDVSASQATPTATICTLITIHRSNVEFLQLHSDHWWGVWSRVSFRCVISLPTNPSHGGLCNQDRLLVRQQLDAVWESQVFHDDRKLSGLHIILQHSMVKTHNLGFYCEISSTGGSTWNFMMSHKINFKLYHDKKNNKKNFMMYQETDLKLLM